MQKMTLVMGIFLTFELRLAMLISSGLSFDMAMVILFCFEDTYVLAIFCLK